MLDADNPDPLVVRRIRRRLLVWGRHNFQEFDWRTVDDPWLTLVAEVLLQRTRARQVEAVFQTFRQKFPTARALLEAGPDAAGAVTFNLGIHWRGPLLYRMARAVVEAGGSPPEDISELRAITGVGPYTAAAWLSMHRGRRAAIVDGNVSRWLGRMTGRLAPRDPRHVRWINLLADTLTPRRAFRDYNYAVLDFTMLICQPKRPCCERCPLRDDCQFGHRALADT